MTDGSDLLFLTSAVLASLGVFAHEFLGAPKVLGPLKLSGLPVDIVWLHHFSWHVASVAVLAMIALFALAAWRSDGFIRAAVAAAKSSGFAAIGLSRAVFGDHALWRTPGALSLDANRHSWRRRALARGSVRMSRERLNRTSRGAWRDACERPDKASFANLAPSGRRL
ncbi:hypothetical protein ACWCOP_01280 [Maricaulaceae bacterium MS644]